MGLFKRKPPIDDEAPRCPECRERVPEGATECAMCGRDLQDESPARRPGAGLGDAPSRRPGIVGISRRDGGRWRRGCRHDPTHRPRHRLCVARRRAASLGRLDLVHQGRQRLVEHAGRRPAGAGDGGRRLHVRLAGRRRNHRGARRPATCRSSPARARCSPTSPRRSPTRAPTASSSSAPSTRSSRPTASKIAFEWFNNSYTNTWDTLRLHRRRRPTAATCSARSRASASPTPTASPASRSSAC